MSVLIRGNGVNVAGITQNAGIFIGQNIQDGWDSFSPIKFASSFNMGDYNTNICVISYLLTASWEWQSIHDEDFKGNRSTRIVR